MEEIRERVVTYDDLQLFRQQLSKYEMYQLETFYEYFRDDLIYVIETIDTLSILRELNFRNLISVEYYLSVKKECGVSVFAQLLVQDVLDMGKDTVLGLWESLYALQSDHPHPNLLGMLDEISKTGHDLEQWILWDQHGHFLSDELKDVQAKHKQHLQEKTENLVEHRAPGSKKEPKYFNISERYVDLIVVSNQHFRKRTQHEVIERGVHEHYMQKAQNRLERITPNRLFRWCRRSRCVPHAVMVSGVPGVGKTTLLQKFVYDWVNGKLYQRFAFVFFFKFRTLNKLEMTSLESMILEQYPYLQSSLHTIFQDPAKLLFIFDGLDECIFHMDFKSNQLCTNPQSLVNLSTIVVSLVRQSLLKDCSVLMTSRPTKLASVETNAFQRVSEIMGFFSQQRQMYFQNFFGKKGMSEKAFHYVRENGILYTFCYIPSYCWIICTVLSMCFKDKSTKTSDIIQLLPKTVTQLFVTFVTNILSNHSQSTPAPEVLTSLGWMAEHGVMRHILTYDEQDLRKFNVDVSSQLLSSFLLESLQPPHVTYSFFHLTIQEFLAALAHYLDYSSERLQQALEDANSFEDGRGEIFLRFISGLSDGSTRSLLKPYFNELSVQASRDVIGWFNESVCRDMIQEVDKRKRLNAFAYLYESRNKALVSQSLGTNRRFDFSGFHLAPMDCTILEFVIESCREMEALDLEECYIHSEGLERLAPALHNIIDLRLSENNLKDEDMQFIYPILTNPMCRIQNLCLRDNLLTENCCSPLAIAISENQSLRALDLANNKLAGQDFIILLEALSNPSCKIEALSLQETKLTPEYARSLVSLSNNPNLTHLNLNFNMFGDADSKYIEDLIERSPSLREVRLSSNSFSTHTEEVLKQLEALRPGLKIDV
ncbi:LOW QUALITY PROTEIN: NACHT, LRR and PYD domains-containing protein 12-like [Rhinophrynus dorsalis]